MLVSTQWLEENLGREDLVVLDASLAKAGSKAPLPAQKPNVIALSQRCDLDGGFCNPDSNVLRAFPTQEQFEREINRLGIRRDDTVVVYDARGIYSSPRAWWIFQSMGFGNTFILDGGLPKWLAEGRPTQEGYKATSPTSTFQLAAFEPGAVCDADHVLKNIDNEDVVVLDARSAQRYAGLAPEPRAGLRSGHIPRSINMPFGEVLDGFCFKPKDELKALFAALDVDDASQLVFSCGSGVTACIILAAATMAGLSRITLYDGSWAEWGGDERWPVAR